jgi:hypothetical protein
VQTPSLNLHFVDGLFETFIQDTLDSSEFDNLLSDISCVPSLLPEKVNKSALPNHGFKSVT